MNICQQVSSFGPKEHLTIFQHSLVDALPCAPIVTSTLKLFQETHPQFLLDDIQDTDGEDFIVTQENREKIANLYLARRAKFPEANRATLKDKIISTIDQRRDMISKVSKDFGIPADFAISVPLDSVSTEALCTAMGNRSSVLSNPVIIMTPPKIQVTSHNVEHALASDDEKEEKINLQKKDFVFAHEMVHIKERHGLITSIATLGFGIISLGIWIKGLREKISLRTCAVTYGITTGIAYLFNIFSFALKRAHEKEADLGAIKYLKTDEGALAFFQSRLNLDHAHDLEHPSPQERYNYCKAASNK